MGESEHRKQRNSTKKREGNSAELRACAECTAMCISLHWSKNDLYPCVSSFFKVMIGPDWNKLLFLPPKFAATVTDLEGKRTELVNANGEKWTVTLSSFHQGYAFQMGWEDFAFDNNLTMGDFLLFYYIKRSHFMVQIYGRSGCEKICNGPLRRRNQCKGNVSSPARPREKKSMDITRKLSLSSSGSLGTTSEQSDTNRTLDSEGDNIKSPCPDSDSCYFKGLESEKSNEAGAGTSSPTHTGMRLQAEANKDFIGTGNLKSNIFTKLTNVGMTEKDKALKFNDRTRKCKSVALANLSNSLPWRPCEEPGKQGNDRSSCYANEDAVFNHSGRKSTGDLKKMVNKDQQGRSEPVHSQAKRKRGTIFKNSGEKSTGDLKKMVKIERQDRSEPVHGHAKKKSDMESPLEIIPHYKQVKLEPLDGPSLYDESYDAVTCLAATDTECLDLPSRLPDFIFRRMRAENKTKGVVLRDPKGRMWPALYQVRSGLHFLICNWNMFNQANGIRAGDSYAIRVEDASQFIYRIDILPQI